VANCPFATKTSSSAVELRAGRRHGTFGVVHEITQLRAVLMAIWLQITTYEDENTIRESAASFHLQSFAALDRWCNWNALAAFAFGSDLRRDLGRCAVCAP